MVPRTISYTHLFAGYYNQVNSMESKEGDNEKYRPKVTRSNPEKIALN